ncbi:hypothetical protein HID58_094552 [Brassica napus]|uniref:Protein FAR1-RELATED SEQUENCE n=1 Tax=Brassica napus TaxID=3708 RepID=A0ABQ7X6X8_BRANA|nr:hypothetical protein HID58_094552 [Brassica napus]
MDIDLRLHSGDLCKEGDDEEHRGLDNEDIDISKIEDDVTVEPHTDNNGITLPEHNTQQQQQQGVNLEPLNGMEFNSHGEAYTFYQEYSRTIGFNTAIQNSRRSKPLESLSTPSSLALGTVLNGSTTSLSTRPRARQSKQDHPENNMAGRRTCAKTDCKASMHVKRKPDGKWLCEGSYHELLPAQAVSEQTRKIYAAMAKQFAEFEEEAKADSETWNKPPTMKSPSPFEKSVSDVYTPAVFKKFQIEVLGAIACSPREENRDARALLLEFRILKTIRTSWLHGAKQRLKLLHVSAISADTRLTFSSVVIFFHPLSVHIETVDQRCKKPEFPGEPQQLQTRLQSIHLSRELQYCLLAIEEALGNCAGVNTSGRSLPDVVASPTGLISVEEDNQSRSAVKTTSKKKNPTKKRKVNSEQEVIPVTAPESLQQMDKLSPRTVGLESPVNLMAPNRDNFYGNQQTIQGLRQLNSIAPSYDSYYTAQQGIHGQILPSSNFTYDIRDDPNVRTTQLHEDASRHT